MGGGNALGAKRVISDYNTTAGIYDERYAAEQETKIAFLTNRLRPGAGTLVLDVGCGTGRLLEGLKGRSFCVGIDPSSGMLLEARRKGFWGDLILADAEHIPIRSGMVDFVFSVSVLQLLDQPAEGAREMLRVLKEGGWIGASALLKSFTGEGLKALFSIADGEAYESETMKDAFLIAQKR
jgi:ubiquinone/menaquinone biosynthesis C-methylase UbiE